MAHVAGTSCKTRSSSSFDQPDLSASTRSMGGAGRSWNPHPSSVSIEMTTEPTIGSLPAWLYHRYTLE